MLLSPGILFGTTLVGGWFGRHCRQRRCRGDGQQRAPVVLASTPPPPTTTGRSPAWPKTKVRATIASPMWERPEPAGLVLLHRATAGWLRSRRSTRSSPEHGTSKAPQAARASKTPGSDDQHEARECTAKACAHDFEPGTSSAIRAGLATGPARRADPPSHFLGLEPLFRAENSKLLRDYRGGLP